MLLNIFNNEAFLVLAETLVIVIGSLLLGVLLAYFYWGGMRNKINELEIEIAAEKKKIPALTEFGYGTLPDSTWWTSTFAKALEGHKIAYALAWRNAGGRPNGTQEFYVPYKGHASAEDFRKLYANGRILFQKEATKENLYK